MWDEVIKGFVAPTVNSRIASVFELESSSTFAAVVKILLLAILTSNYKTLARPRLG